MPRRWTPSEDVAVRLADAVDTEDGDLAARTGSEGADQLIKSDVARVQSAVRQRASRLRAVQLEGDVAGTASGPVLRYDVPPMPNTGRVTIPPELWKRLEVAISGRRSLKALSVRQPWANLIADGSKTIEVRSKATNHRGPLLIVSAKRPDVPPAGCAVAVVNLVDCRPMTQADERAAMTKREPGNWAWVLTLINRIEPQAVNGQLSFFEVPITIPKREHG